MQAGIGPVADRGHLRGSGDLGTPRDRSPLWAKFPNQLGGREPIVRRTDLGAKGIYYRASIGPFVSMKAAARVCSSLKAAGESCLVEKN
jgi:SPOR domain